MGGHFCLLTQHLALQYLKHFGWRRYCESYWDGLRQEPSQTTILKVKHICANVQHLPFKLYIRIKSFNVMMIFN